MNDVSVDLLVRELSDILLSWPQREITGSQLGDLIVKRFPALNLRLLTGIETGPGALSRFIGMRLSNVLWMRGKSGADVVYGIQQSNQSAASTAEIDELSALREIIQYAIARMSMEELRRVMIPAGLACEAARYVVEPLKQSSPWPASSSS